jgi:hypothetical protein
MSDALMTIDWNWEEWKKFSPSFKHIPLIDITNVLRGRRFLLPYIHTYTFVDATSAVS